MRSTVRRYPLYFTVTGLFFTLIMINCLTCPLPEMIDQKTMSRIISRVSSAICILMQLRLQVILCLLWCMDSIWRPCQTLQFWLDATVFHRTFTFNMFVQRYVYNFFRLLDGQPSKRLNSKLMKDQSIPNLTHWSHIDRYGSNSTNVFVKLILQIDILSSSCETGLRRMTYHPIDNKSTLVQVVAWCHQDDYLKQYYVA